MKTPDTGIEPEKRLVYLLRHAIAQAPQPHMPDELRELTARGREQAETVADFVRHQKIPVGCVYTSPHWRAAQTAHLFAQHVRPKVSVHYLSWLKIHSTSADQLAGLYALLDDVTDGAVLVGHEPDFSSLLANILGATRPQAFKIRKASLTCLEFERNENHQWQAQLRWSLPCDLM